MIKGERYELSSQPKLSRQKRKFLETKNNKKWQIQGGKLVLKPVSGVEYFPVSSGLKILIEWFTGEGLKAKTRVSVR